MIICASQRGFFHAALINIPLKSGSTRPSSGLANGEPGWEKKKTKALHCAHHPHISSSVRFIRMCCVSKAWGQIRHPAHTGTATSPHISHPRVEFCASSCTRGLIVLSICTDNTPPYRHNGIFARDICVLRIHSQGWVTRARALPLHAEGEKPVVRRH